MEIYKYIIMSGVAWRCFPACVIENDGWRVDSLTDRLTDRCIYVCMYIPKELKERTRTCETYVLNCTVGYKDEV